MREMNFKQSDSRYLKNFKEASSMGFGASISSPNDSMIDSIVNRFDLGGLILDMGCGVGYDCLSFNKRGLKPIGLDFNPSLLRLAKKHMGNLDFVVGDASQLPFRQGIFEVIFSKGLSLFSTTEVEFCRKFIEKTMLYLRNDHPLMIVLSTDLSGKLSRSHWINHSLDDVRQWCKDMVVNFFFVYNVWKISVLEDIMKLIPVFSSAVTDLFLFINKIYRRKGYLFAVMQKVESPPRLTIPTFNPAQYGPAEVMLQEGEIIAKGN